MPHQRSQLVLYTIRFLSIHWILLTRTVSKDAVNRISKPEKRPKSHNVNPKTCPL